MNESTMKWVKIVAAVAIALGVGYYFGLLVGANRGLELGIVQGVEQEKAIAAARQTQAQQKAAQSVNPFQQTPANPFQKSPANPYENIKVNPFQ